MAPTQIGPFVTDQAELRVGIRLEPWATLPVRVLNADGTPARKVRVLPQRDVSIGTFHVARQPDADGGVVFQGCAPGAYHLQVWGAKDKLLEQTALLTSGLNPEVVLRLPAVAATGR